MRDKMTLQRQIKSFVLRAGRISKRQQMALESWASHYEIEVKNKPWCFETLFNRDAQTIVEIGFGMGSSLFTMASQSPELNFVGIEVHRAGVGSLVADLHEHQVENVRVVSHDAVEVFGQNIPDASLAGVQIFFPDPWPKKKHHKRRLVQSGFIEMCASKIKSGGFIHCATDWEDYASHMMDVLVANQQLKNSRKNSDFSPRPDSRPLTKFEKRGAKLGHGIWDLVFIKK